MEKTSHIINPHMISGYLMLLAEHSRKCEMAHLAASRLVPKAEDKALFIYFWQEYARMTSELLERARELERGKWSSPLEPPAMVLFDKEGTVQDIAAAIEDCERHGADALILYDHFLRGILPVDVRRLLKSHLVNLEAIQIRLSHYPSTADLISC